MNNSISNMLQGMLQLLLIAASLPIIKAFSISPFQNGAITLPNSNTFTTSTKTNTCTNNNHATFSPIKSYTKSATSSSTQLQMETIECDVAIIGGGPAGCTCALYTARGNLKTCIIDKNPTAGALAITSTIANYPGITGYGTTTGQELLDTMRQQAIDYGAEYRRAQVFMVDFDEENEINTIYSPDVTVKARSLVLATGALGRTPVFNGEADFLGKGVSYCATCDGAFYQDSPVAVVGVTTEAMQEAEFLTKFASKVHWITRSDIQKGTGDAQAAKDLLEHDNVQQWENTRLIDIKGDVSGVTGIEIQTRGEAESTMLDLEGVFIYDTGCKPITDYISSKIQFKEDGGVQVDDEMATNVPSSLPLAWSWQPQPQPMPSSL